MKGEELFKVTLGESETTYPLIKKYLVEYYSCDNCGREKCYYIPNGIPVRDHLKNIKCEWCKCNVVKEKERY